MNLIPSAVEAWIRKKIRAAAVDRKLEHLKYVPYRFGAQSFVVPLSPDPNLEIDDGLPIPPRWLWLGYADTVADYLESGRRDVETMRRLLADTGFPLADSRTILDLGCGGGRMMRHLRRQAEVAAVWGADVDSNCIFWLKRHLSPPFRLFTSTTSPHLPFADRSFDLVYCGSVFTHLDDLAEAWFLELRRVLALDGRLYATIQDGHTIEVLETRFADRRLTGVLRGNKLYQGSRGTFGMLSIGRSLDAQVFYDIEYLSKILRPTFEILSVTPEAYGWQTAVVLRPK